jgi:chromosome partitioning protein
LNIRNRSRYEMGKVITFGIQKGGAGKTSTSSITAYLLATSGYKVLAIDMDCQGNMTELLTMTESKNFRDISIAEALEEEDIAGRIITFPEIDRLHLVPANDDLAAFSDYALLKFLDLDKNGRVVMDEGVAQLKPEVNHILKRTLDKVKDQYHYIILDTPPNLSRTTVNALAASDEVVIVFEPARFCFSAIENFIGTIEHVQEKINPELHIAGIISNSVDIRRYDNKEYLDMAREKYGDLLFDSMIKRRASIGRIPDTGFIQDNKLFSDLGQYASFVKELLGRVKCEQRA